MSFPRQLWRLFTSIVIEGRASCDLQLLWRTSRASMSEDVRRRLRRLELLPNEDNPINGDGGGDGDGGDGGDGGDAAHPVYAVTLRLIGRQLQRIGGLTLADVGLPQPPEAPVEEPDEPPPEGHDEAAARHQAYVDARLPLLTDDQRAVHAEVVHRLDTGEGGLLFLQAPGGEFATLLREKVIVLIISVNNNLCHR